MLLLVEGFEGFGTSTGVAPQPAGIVGRNYSVAFEAQMDIEVGRLGGYCLEFVVAGCQLKAVFTTTHDTMIVGFAIKYPGTLSDGYIFKLYSGATLGISLRLTPAGQIQVFRSAALLGTSPVVIAPGPWYYIEFKVKCNNSIGTYELRVGGVNVLSDSGIDTQAGEDAYHDAVRLDYASGAAGGMFFDDWYVCDGSGSVNNDFLGNCRVDAIFPDGDDVAGWDIASGAGDHYLDVDEVVADDNTSYVEYATTGHKDLYDYAAMPADRGAIRGLEIKTLCRETDAEDFSLITPIKSGATETDDSAQSIGTTDYVAKKRVSELDPNTSTAWTKTTVDAAKFGVKVG